MPLGVFRISGPLARLALAAAALVCIAVAGFSAVWSFANGASVRADIREAADLMIWLGPSDPQTHFAAAVIYEKTFEPADALRSLKEYETAAGLAPYNYLVWLELGRSRERSGDARGAELAFQRAMELAPNYAAVRWAFGNSLIRAGRTDEGFALVRQAALARPEYLNPAVTIAMSLFDGDIEQVRGALGDTGEVNSTLAALLFSREQYDGAIAAWDRIPAGEKRDKFRAVGDELASKFAGVKQFRRAARIAADTWDSGSSPTTGAIMNGGFESAVKMKDARLFDWQVTGGGETQIGLSDTQKHGGSYSLHMIFNTMLAADFRQVSQTLAVEPGASLSFEAFYRADLKGALAWEIVDAADGKVLARTAAIAPSADWARISADLTAGTSDAVTIRLVRDGCTSSVCPISGKVWFDDISLRQKLTTDE